MKKIILFLLLTVSMSISSQTIEKFSIDSGGSNSISGGLEILYTIGEVNMNELNTATISVSEGFINPTNNSVLLIDEIEFTKNYFSVYPNPTSEIIHIDSEVIINKVELFDLLGKQVISTNEITEINLNKLSKGIYILKVFSEIGIVTKKVLFK